MKIERPSQSGHPFNTFVDGSGIRTRIGMGGHGDFFLEQQFPDGTTRSFGTYSNPGVWIYGLLLKFWKLAGRDIGELHVAKPKPNILKAYDGYGRTVGDTMRNLPIQYLSIPAQNQSKDFSVKVTRGEKGLVLSMHRGAEEYFFSLPLAKRLLHSIPTLFPGEINAFALIREELKTQPFEPHKASVIEERKPPATKRQRMSGRKRTPVGWRPKNPRRRLR